MISPFPCVPNFRVGVGGEADMSIHDVDDVLLVCDTVINSSKVHEDRNNMCILTNVRSCYVRGHEETRLNCHADLKKFQINFKLSELKFYTGNRIPLHLTLS